MNVETTESPETESGGGMPFWAEWITHDGSWRQRKETLFLGAELAALRKGAGREPGTVPAMWEHYTEDPGSPRVVEGGRLSPRFVAEHHALVLFGFHQQSQRTPVHRDGAALGKALKVLHVSGRFSEDAVDRRFLGAIVADEVGGVAYHLRGLVMQLRSLDVVPSIDYSKLVNDLADWASPVSRDRVRRRWGLDYHAFDRDEKATAATTNLDSTPPD